MVAALMKTSATSVGLRVAAAVVGGYAFTWGFIALGAMALFAAGMDLAEARNLFYMLGLLCAELASARQ